MFDADNHLQTGELSDPLPIPATVFDFLGPHQSNLPVNVFQTPPVKPLIKEGDRLIGSASVMCPDCTRGFTYWVYIEWGRSGWYSEIPDMENGAPVFPKKQVNSEDFLKYVLQETSKSTRIPIENPD